MEEEVRRITAVALCNFFPFSSSLISVFLVLASIKSYRYRAVCRAIIKIGKLAMETLIFGKTGIDPLCYLLLSTKFACSLSSAF
jgi:hypothetical protein